MSVSNIVPILLAASLVGCLPERKEEPPPPPPVPEEPPIPAGTDPEPAPAYVPDPAAVEALTVDKTAEVSILCYHDFTASSRSQNPMVMPIAKFREQMDALHRSKTAVIGMPQFLAWRRGEADIPDPSVIITIDDGWKAVHTLALPIFKGYEFPFTVFAYSRYVGGGSKALTKDQYRDILANGGTIGCHSTTHPLPSRVRAASKSGGKKYDDFILREMAESRAFLEKTFGIDVNTYAYPGGIFTDRMIELNQEQIGYDALFTINPAKVKWDTPREQIHRYVIHADNDQNFRRATTFAGSGQSILDQASTLDLASGENRKVPILTPTDGAQITVRNPVISADLSAIGPINPASLRMSVTGIGTVPATYDQEKSLLSWVPLRTLRAEDWQVTVRFKKQGSQKEDRLTWKFSIDPMPHYLLDSEA